MNKKIVISLLILFSGISLFLHFFKWGQVPPCLNADELSYGYNAYSLLKTGKDEFGNFLPLRLKSFGDYKLPLYSYLTIPFVAVFGLNEFGVRLPTVLAAVLLIWAVYFLCQALFQNKRLSLIAAFLTSVSPWVNGIMSHHAHEGVVTILFLTLGWLFLIYYQQKPNVKNAFWFIFFSCLSLYAYHFARIFLVAYLVVFAYLSYQKRVKLQTLLLPFLLLLLFTLPFVFSELTTPPTRLAHLSITTHPGAKIIAQELKIEFGKSPFNRYLFVLGNEILNRYLDYFSPRFLTIRGDENARFGFEGISLITLAEYLLLIFGLFAFWKKINFAKLTVLLVLFLSPIAGSLTFQTNTFTRVFMMIVPVMVIVAWTVNELINSQLKFKRLLLGLLILIFAIYNLRSWEFFFFHYNFRGINVRSWDCGYKEIAEYCAQNYSRFQQFHITKEAGQSYIGILFFQKYDPAKFQNYTSRLPPDQNGYLNVSAFDKYVFDVSDFKIDNPHRNLYFFTDVEGKKYNLIPKRITPITKGIEQLYWVYPKVKPLPQ